uniref:Uncharacterized protein n=1 Tax=Caenorhabditis japonica TaxID=281687 RepID=A0A8R1EFD3_CAEJA
MSWYIQAVYVMFLILSSSFFIDHHTHPDCQNTKSFGSADCELLKEKAKCIQIIETLLVDDVIRLELNISEDVFRENQTFVKPMIEEDVFRCLQSIQDRALRVTEHLRLTIITMMMPYVNTLSERFDEIMRMYSNTSYQDNVAQYVLTLTKPRCRSNYMKTLLEAREVVNSWGGSVEAENYAQNVVSVSKNSDQPPSDNSSRSILKKREGNDEIRMLIDENEEQKHLEEMIKLEKAFIVFQRMNGEDENSMKDEIYI